MTLVNLSSATLSTVDQPTTYAVPDHAPATQTSQALAAFHRLSGAERFDFIKAVYARIGNTVTDRVAGARWSSLAHRLSCKVGQVNQSDRFGVIRDILNNHDTRFSRAYSELDTNTRLAFWHRLVRAYGSRQQATGCQSVAVQELVTLTEQLSADEQLEFLTQTVNQMGV
ncbi:MAG: orange carotenoid protein N-terminal domain-containing protein [Cyanobacteria bacterium J06648_16]